jgi:DNA-directed RNA polymerase subunit RPC12/RpoP
LESEILRRDGGRCPECGSTLLLEDTDYQYDAHGFTVEILIYRCPECKQTFKSYRAYRSSWKVSFGGY